MADINEKLNQTEEELKKIEKQAEATTDAVKKLTNAEAEAEMRAALLSAHTIEKPNKNINKQTEKSVATPNTNNELKLDKNNIMDYIRSQGVDKIVSKVGWIYGSEVEEKVLKAINEFVKSKVNNSINNREEDMVVRAYIDRLKGLIVHGQKPFGIGKNEFKDLTFGIQRQVSKDALNYNNGAKPFVGVKSYHPNSYDDYAISMDRKYFKDDVNEAMKFIDKMMPRALIASHMNPYKGFDKEYKNAEKIIQNYKDTGSVNDKDFQSVWWLFTSAVSAANSGQFSKEKPNSSMIKELEGLKSSSLWFSGEKHYNDLISSMKNSNIQQVSESIKPVEDVVKTITDNVTKQVDAASKQVEDTVKSTVEYISNTINGFTLIGGVADELKKQFALIPMGKSYTKGEGFNMFEPDPKQLPAIRKSAELAAYDNIIDAEYREIEPLEKKRDIEAAIASIREKIHNRDKDSQFYHDTDAEQKKLDILKEQTAEYEKQRDYERALVGHFAYDGGKELNKDNLAYLSDKFKDVKTPEVFGQEQAQKAKEAGDQVKVTVDDVRNRINEVVNDIKQSIANIIKVIRVANDILHKTAIGIISAFQMAGNAIQRIISLFGNLANRVRETNRQTNILKGTWTELNSMVRLLSGAFNKLFNNQFINEGRQLLSSIQSLNMIIGSELTAETISWAENLEYAFGLSAAELISNLKQVSAILYGLGMSSKNVAIAGKNLETVGMQLSVVTGYDYSTVMTKIQSGLKGMTQSVDDLGISVRETQMDAFLKKLKAQGGEYANIGTSFSQLTEQQRIYVRYAAIMDQITSRSAYSAENYAKSLETITGKMSILTSQLKALKASIGTLALKLFEKIIMPLTYIVYLVNQLIKKIAELLGIDIKLDVGMNGGEAQEPIDDITDGINDMADAADKAKGSLDGLDHVSTMSDSKNNIKDAFDYSKLMDINGDYSDLLSKLEDMNNNYIEKCKEALLKMLEDMKNRITDWVKDVTGRFIDWDYIKSNLYGAWVNIKNTFKNIVEIAKNAWKIIGGLLWSIGDDLDFSRLFFKFTKAFERLTKLVAVILDKIQKPIQNMYDKFLSPYVEKLGDWIEDKLNTLIAYFNNMIGWWEDPRNKDAINDWFDNLGKNIKAIIIMFKGLFGGELTDEEKDFLTTGESYEKGFYKMYNTATKVHDAIMGIVVAIKVLAGIPLDLNKDLERFDKTPNQVKTLIGICQTLHSILKSIWDIIKETITTIFDFNNSGALDWGDLQIALDWIKEKLDWVKKWFDENKETIINVLSEAAKTVGKIGEVKLDIIMQVLEFITSHGELIENVLKSVQELLDFVAKHPVVAMTAAIGLQVAGTLVKGYLTARFWKWALGLNGATTAGTSIGSSIAGAIHAGIMKLKWGSVIAELDGLSASEVAATSSFGLTGAAATAAAVGIVGTTIAAVTAELKAGIPQVKSLWDDMWADFGNDFGSFTDEFGNKREITTDNTKAWAYDIHEALKRVYGDEIPTGAFDNAMSHVMAELESTGELTFEQTEAIRKNIEKQYKAMGDTGWLDEWNYSTDNSEQIINNLSESLTGLSEDVSSTSNEVKGTVSETKTSVNSDIDDINKKTQELNNNWSMLHAPLGSFANDFKNQFRSIYTTVSQICAGLSSRISNLFSRVGQLVSRSNQLNNWASSVTSKTSGWSPIKLKGFGYANGGVPSSGSIFFANENGNTELVGNFGGYSGVANQSMIIEAMQNAMVQAIRSAGGMGNGGTTVNNFNIGNWLGDDASVRKLANRINTVNAKSNSNIANVGFVMS